MLGCNGPSYLSQNFILENVHRLLTIPIRIVHGRFDNVCPMFQADELVDALRRAGHESVELRRPPAGHSMTERENCLALTDIIEQL